MGLSIESFNTPPSIGLCNGGIKINNMQGRQSRQGRRRRNRTIAPISFLHHDMFCRVLASYYDSKIVFGRHDGEQYDQQPLLV